MGLKLVFVDLDDSLVRSLRRARGPSARVGYIDDNGKAAGVQSVAEAHLFDWLTSDSVVIPVTARGLSSFARIELPFAAEAICCNGGAILDQKGHIDPHWHAQIRTLLAPHQPDLIGIQDAVAQIASRLGHPIRQRIVSVHDVGIFLNIKHTSRSSTGLCAVVDRLSVPEGWRIICHDHAAAITPPALDKSLAVRALIEQYAPELVIGLGDSRSDVGFLSLCDFAMLPTSSTLFELLK